MFAANINDINFNKKFNVLTIENAFDKNTNNLILDEMINNEPNYIDAKISNEFDDKKTRNNLSCYYDTLYNNKRQNSALLRELDNLFQNTRFSTLVLSMDSFPFYLFTQTNTHETQVSRYGNSDNYYNYHVDTFGNFSRLITLVYYAHKEPKKYNGGEIVFSNDLLLEPELDSDIAQISNNDQNKLVIEPKNNMLVVFSSFKPHSVLKTSSPENFQDGRFSANIWVGSK